MWRKNIVITQKRYRKKNRSFLTICFSLIILVTLLLFLWNKEFLNKLQHIDKNIDKILFIKNKFLFFQDGDKKINYDLEKKTFEEIGINLDNRVIIDIFDEKNILVQEQESLVNSLGDVVHIKGLEKVTSKDNFIIVKANGKYGAFDNRLKKVIPLEYEYLAKGEELFLAKNRDGKIGYLNLEGDVQIPFHYDIGDLDKDGEVVVAKDGKVGVVSLKDKTILELKFNNLINLSPNKIVNYIDNFYFYSPNLPEKKLDITWAGLYNGKTFFYEKNSKFGLMNRDGKKLTENMYEELSQKNIEAIITRKNGKYGLINQEGNEVAQNIYDYIIPIGDNFFIAGYDGNETPVILNHLGSKIFYEDRYEEYLEVSKEYLIASKDEKLKLLNNFGKYLDDVEKILVSNRKWLIYKNKFGINYINLRGEV